MDFVLLRFAGSAGVFPSSGRGSNGLSGFSKISTGRLLDIQKIEIRDPRLRDCSYNTNQQVLIHCGISDGLLASKKF